jgi:putative transposase
MTWQLIDARWRSLTLEALASAPRLQPRFIEPGTPVQNAFVESFQGRFRDECLDRHWFVGLSEARHTSEIWRQDYNQSRPHSALGYRPPEEFRQAFEAAEIRRL